jgi:hypothetical protein
VTLAPTTTTLTSNLNPALAGQPILLTANVASTVSGLGTVGGTVAFYNGTNLLGTATLNNGVAGLQSTTLLPVGNDPITAIFQGNSTFQTSSSTGFIQQTIQAATVTSVGISNSNPPVNTGVTLTAYVVPLYPANGAPTGSVLFYANGAQVGMATLSNGVARISLSGFPIGSEVITATFVGDHNYSSSIAFKQTVLVGTEVERFVNQVFVTTLHRSANDAELTHWSNLLSNGYPTRKFLRTIKAEARREGIKTNRHPK